MHFTFTLILIFNAFFLFSQTDKGSLMLYFEGQLTHYHATYSNLDEKFFAGNMEIEAGYAFVDNLFFGVKYNPIYQFGTPGFDRFSVSNYGIFSRYYFLENKNRIYLHTDYNHQKDARSDGYHQWNLALGYAYFLSPNAAIEAHFNYNVYNGIPDIISVDPNDPIVNTENDPQGLNIQLQLHYFLPFNNNSIKHDRLPLVDRYLKKGNRYLFISGEIARKLFGYIGSFEKSKFLRNDLQIRHRFMGFGSFGKDVRLGSIDFYLPSVEKYFPIKKQFYYTPSIGIGPTLAFFDDFRWENFGWMANAQIGFDYFLKNAHLRTGYTFYASDFFTDYTDIYTSSNLYLSSEFFISEKLSIRPEAFYKIHGDYIQFFRWENQEFIEARKFRLQFGFSYYY